MTFHALPHGTPSETLRTLEEIRGEETMKKTQVYESHERFRNYPHCRLEVFFNGQCLPHYEFIPEGRTVNKETYSEVLCRLKDAVRRKRLEQGHETACLFCVTTHLHIGR
jgi:hypothetical protein